MQNGMIIMKKILPMIVFALSVISCKSETIETEKIDNTVKVQNSVSINDDKEKSTLDNKALENQQASSFVKVKKGDCKGLHKVTDVDDLLKQFYDNIDSDCLFKIGTDDLEKIWGIRVFDLSGEFDQDKVDKRFQYEKEGDGLFVVKFDYTDREYFRIFPTLSLIKQDDGIWGDTNLSQGEMPSNFPPPIVPKQKQKIRSPHFRDSTEYVWLNKEKSIHKPYLLIVSSDSSKTFGIVAIYRNATHDKRAQKLYFDIQD